MLLSGIFFMFFGIYLNRRVPPYWDSRVTEYGFQGQRLTWTGAFARDRVVFSEPSKATKSHGHFTIAMVEWILPNVAKRTLPSKALTTT